MFDTLLSPITPHLCCGCGKIGHILCDNCKYDIVSEQMENCLLCGIKNNDSVCVTCHSITPQGWCVGQRVGTLRKLIDDFKFENVRAAHKVLAGLLDDRIAILPPTTRVIPVPTLSRHIRQRGYDHMVLVAQEFAKRRKLHYYPVLRRITNTTQRNASRTERLSQAKNAFRVKGELSPTTPYLLIDDIVTTGATLVYGAKALREAGAKEVWIAVVARQPLD